MPKNLYIYQREEYDEGMGVFSDVLRLDICASLHSATATIFYNMGQLSMRLNEGDAALKYFQLALHFAESGSDGYSLQGCCLSAVAILHNITHIEH